KPADRQVCYTGPQGFQPGSVQKGFNPRKNLGDVHPAGISNPPQLGLGTKGLTAKTTSVPPRRSGPPESPKQVPPDPPPGLKARRMNSSLWANWPETNSLGA